MHFMRPCVHKRLMSCSEFLIMFDSEVPPSSLISSSGTFVCSSDEDDPFNSIEEGSEATSNHM